MPKACAGFTVVELADPRNQFAGKIMADMGARVIQVEPLLGSPGRWCGPFAADREDPNQCLDYWSNNTGKESVCIDIARKPGQDLLRMLLSHADVFIESTQPGTLQEFGQDYTNISAQSPGLIYASLTDFGQDGPWINYRMNDHAHLALGGQMGSSGYSEPSTTPIGGHGHQAYNMASVMLVHSIMVALFERLTSGEGQQIDCAIHDCCAICTERAVSYWLWYNETFLRQTGQHAGPRYRPSQQVQAGDGRYLQATTGRFNNDSWVQMVAWMQEVGVAGELAGEQWQDEFYRAEQNRNGTAIRDGVIRLLGKVSGQDAFLRAQELGLPWAVVRAPEENMEFDHYKERGFWVPVEHPELEHSVLYPRGFFSCDEIGMSPAYRAPERGEHTRAILTNDLGLDQTHIASLMEIGVVG